MIAHSSRKAPGLGVGVAEELLEEHVVGGRSEKAVVGAKRVGTRMVKDGRQEGRKEGTHFSQLAANQRNLRRTLQHTERNTSGSKAGGFNKHAKATLGESLA